MSEGRARGQHAGLSRPAVLEAAVALVDEHGLGALSMRRLGAELGVEAMALYHYVSSKQDLMDGLVEQLFAQALPALEEGEGPWQETMRRFARVMLQTLLDHQALVPVILSRPATTPAVLGILEHALTVLRQAGFSPAQALDLVYALIGFVVGHVATGGDATDRSATRYEQLAVLDTGAWPLLTEAVGAATSARPTSTFDVTLEAILGGFA